MPAYQPVLIHLRKVSIRRRRGDDFGLDSPEKCDVCNGILPTTRTDDIIPFAKTDVENAPEAFGFAYEALRGVGMPLRRHAVETIHIHQYRPFPIRMSDENLLICLPLYRSQTAMLPCHPLLALHPLRILLERKLSLRIKPSRQVHQNRHALRNSQTAAVVVDQNGDFAIGGEGGVPGFFLKGDFSERVREKGGVGRVITWIFWKMFMDW